MLGLKIVCWSYLIFTMLGRICSYDKCNGQENVYRAIDNVTIIILILLLYFLR